jgi:hypothetical protein
VKKEAIHFSHGAGIVKWPGRSFNPALQITGKIDSNKVFFSSKYRIHPIYFFGLPVGKWI